MCFDALRHSLDCLNYLTLIKRQSVFNFCAIPQVMAMATINECWGNTKVFTTNVKIRKGVALHLMTRTTNPREAAYLFKHYAEQIHKKTLPSDPLFLKVSVLCGKISQWAETRMKTVPEAVQDQRRKAADAQNQQGMGWEDYKFLILVVVGIMAIILTLGGGVFGAVWYFFLREGARYAEWGQDPVPLPIQSGKTEL
ncbi:hypothetical protein BT69DRAFT_867633 [Atractiella rhizophila]|nr:hypothetical protein BT69DRAFT_867633 [Atractiella rhizophila]